MSNIQKWGSFDVETAVEEKEELAATGGGGFLKIKVGRNIWRFLPPPLGMRSPFIRTYQHYIDVPGQPSGVAFNCPKLMARSPCLGCAEADKLRSTGNAADHDVAQRMMAKARIYANVIDRENPEVGPQIVAFGKSVYERLLAIREDEVGGGDYTDPEHGFDIVVTRTGEAMLTKYNVSPARNSTPLGDLTWIEMQADLTRFGAVPTDEEIAAKVSGIFGMTGGPALSRAQAQGRALGRGGVGRPGPARAPVGGPVRAPVGGPGRGRARTAEDDAMNGTDADG